MSSKDMISASLADEKTQLVEALCEVYTPLDEALRLLPERWNNHALRASVAQVVGRDMTIPFSERPFAMLFRNVATPNNECIRAIEMAERAGLEFLYLEYLEDRFCTINPDKRVLGRMVFSHGKNKHEEYMFSKKNVFDLATYDGKPFTEIVTHLGEPLVSFHHRMFSDIYPDVKKYDISPFAKRSGRNCIEAYPFYLSIFTCMGILFEDYDMDSAEERRFVKETILPAMKTVTELYGVKPLIVRLFNNAETSAYWNAYPLSIKSQYGI